MAVTTRSLLGRQGGKLVKQTVTNASATTAQASSTSVLMFEVDNTANSASTFFKVYNNASPTIASSGSTAPYMIFKTPAAKTMVGTLTTSDATLGTASTFAAVTTGGIQGATAPTSSVPSRLVYS